MQSGATEGLCNTTVHQPSLWQACFKRPVFRVQASSLAQPDIYSTDIIRGCILLTTSSWFRVLQDVFLTQVLLPPHLCEAATICMNTQSLRDVGLPWKVSQLCTSCVIDQSPSQLTGLWSQPSPQQRVVKHRPHFYCTLQPQQAFKEGISQPACTQSACHGYFIVQIDGAPSRHDTDSARAGLNHMDYAGAIVSAQCSTCMVAVQHTRNAQKHVVKLQQHNGQQRLQDTRNM